MIDKKREPLDGKMPSAMHEQAEPDAPIMEYGGHSSGRAEEPEESLWESSRESILLLIPPAIVFGTFLFVGVLYPIAFAFSILTITLIFLSILCVLLSPVFTFLSYQVMRTASDNKRSMRILAFVANVVLLCLLPFSLLASCFNIELG